MEQVHYGIDRVRLDKIFRELGGEVTCVRRTGEVRYRHPLIRKTVRADGRRRDAPMHLVKFVLAVIDIQSRSAANDLIY